MTTNDTFVMYEDDADNITITIPDTDLTAVTSVTFWAQNEDTLANTSQACANLAADGTCTADLTTILALGAAVYHKLRAVVLDGSDQYTYAITLVGANGVRYRRLEVDEELT